MHNKISVQLFMLADVIDSEASPSRSMVASVLHEILAAAPKPKAPMQFPPMNGPLRGNPKEPSKSELPPSLKGIVPKEQWYPDPRLLPKNKKPDPNEFGVSVKPKAKLSKPDPEWDDDQEAKDVAKRLDAMKKEFIRENLEMSSIESFCEFLTDNDRDTYTIPEANDFCSAHQMKQHEFDKAMNSDGKYQILKVPIRGIYTPQEVLKKAVDEIGIPQAELEAFIRSFDEDVKKRFLVDSVNIIDSYLENA